MIVGPVTAGAMPVAPVSVARVFSVGIEQDDIAGFADGYVSEEGTGSVCAWMMNHATSRFELGCDDVAMQIDPVLGTISGTVTIPTRVYRERRGSFPSTITLTIEMIGDGAPQPFAGEGIFMGPGYVFADAGATLMRNAVGVARMESSALCKNRTSPCQRAAGTDHEQGVTAITSWTGIGVHDDDPECGIAFKILAQRNRC